MSSLRITMWILEAIAMLVAAITVGAASRAADASPTLLVGGVILAALGIGAFFLGSVGERGDWVWFEHTRARRRALTITRRVAIAVFLVFILATALLVVFGAGFASPAIPALVAVGIAAACACVVGAVLDVERRAPAPSNARANRDRDLTWVERAIDARAWQEEDEPAPDAVDAALERWGQKNSGKGTP